MLDTFTPEQRQIFAYRDGAGPRQADPRAAFSRLLAALDNDDPAELLRTITALTPPPPDLDGLSPDEAALALAAHREAAAAWPQKFIIHEARDAQERLLRAIRVALGVADFEADPERGLTVDETMGLYYHFMGYLNGLKKGSGPAPSGPHGSGSPAPSPTSGPSATS